MRRIDEIVRGIYLYLKYVPFFIVISKAITDGFICLYGSKDIFYRLKNIDKVLLLAEGFFLSLFKSFLNFGFVFVLIVILGESYYNKRPRIKKYGLKYYFGYEIYAMISLMSILCGIMFLTR